MLQGLTIRGWRYGSSNCAYRALSTTRLTSNTIQQDEPLRILFCGSEAFSITSLEALKNFQQSPDSNILSIDVATRKDKAGGRGMKEVRSPEIKRAASALGLRVHQFDTFTGWHLPEYNDSQHPYINLVIAVSFGLMVPPRILNSAKFGGINVHPSMLPNLRGAAPVNWTIMKGHTHTGVTVQTLHPSKFDHGVILDQTPWPGIAIPDPDKTTAHELRTLLAPIGADMLVNAVRSKLYLRPYSEFVPQPTEHGEHTLHSAPKIVPSMKILNPYHDCLTTILRKNRAVPKLWAEIKVDTSKGVQTKRIIFGEGLDAAEANDFPYEEMQHAVGRIPIGLPFAITPAGEDIHLSQRPIFLKVLGESILKIPRLLLAGNREAPATAAAAHAKLFAESQSTGQSQVYVFQQNLMTPQPNS